MKFIPFSIDSKCIINDFFYSQRIEASDMLFGNLYIWHFSRDIQYAIIDDCLVIKTTFINEMPFMFFPLGNGDKKSALLKLREYFLDSNIDFSIRSMEVHQVSELERLFPSEFRIIANRDRFDYLYNIGELISLSGRKFHNKKNHLNKFNNSYPHFTYESISSYNTIEILEEYTKWFNAIANPSDGIKNEFIGIEASLRNFETLGFKGACIKINNKVAAFSFGEQINDDSVVIHIEKANIAYDGIYQAINQQFLLNEWSNLTFVNREEDLGIEGLRKAKMTYNPIRFVEKFEANLIK